MSIEGDKIDRCSASGDEQGSQADEKASISDLERSESDRLNLMDSLEGARLALADLDTLPEAAKQEYQYFRSFVENRFHFKNAAAKQQLLSVFTKEVSEAHSELVSTNPSYDQVQLTIYAGYLSQRMINFLYMQSAHQISNPFDERAALELETKIDYFQGVGSLMPDVGMGAMYKFDTVTAFYEAPNWEFKYGVYMLQRAWLEHTNLVTQALTDRYRWHSLAGDGKDDPNKGIKYKKKTGIRGKLIQLPELSAEPPFVDFSTFDFPALTDTATQLSKLSDYDLIWAGLDASGLYSEGMEREIAFPGLLEGVGRFQKILAINTEQFITEHQNPSSSSRQKLYQDYDRMIRGTGGIGADYETGLWEKYLRSILIGK